MLEIFSKIFKDTRVALNQKNCFHENYLFGGGRRMKLVAAVSVGIYDYKYSAIKG
ncbi:hypothetical protein BH11BAC4_BH11BAC4_10710 [soil metagenome]